MKKIFKLLIAFTFLFVTNVYAYEQDSLGDFVVQYDGFAESEVVNARLVKNLRLDEIVEGDMILPNNFVEEKFALEYNSSPNVNTSILYHGPLTISDTAVLNNLEGTMIFRWRDAILLSDGRYADLEIKVSEITAVIEPAGNTEKLEEMKANTSKYYIPVIANGMGAISDKVGVALSEGHTVLSYGETISLNENGQPISQNELVKLYERTNFKFEMKAYTNNHQFNTPLDGDYKILFGAYDLDVASNITPTVSDPSDPYQVLQAKLQDEYTESIELISGFGKIHSGYKDVNHELGTSLLYTLHNNNLKIRPNYNQVTTLYQSNSFLYPKYDSNYLSGFLTSAKISGTGSSFYWKGSTRCGTTLFTNYEVIINQKHNTGGTVNVKSNIDTNNKELDKVTSENYFSGSQVEYSFKASKGYYIEKVLVNNSQIDFSSGKYVFDDLKFMPKVGSAIDSTGDGDRKSTQSIEVQFLPYNFELHYLNHDKTEDETLMPHDDLTYDTEGKIKENKYTKENEYFTKWKVLDENKEEILDSDNKPIYLNDEDDLEKIYNLDVEFNNGKIYLEAVFAPKNISNPKTFDSSTTMLIVIGFICFSGIVALLIKNSKKLKKSM